MDYVSNNSKIIACDIGASNCDPTPHIDNLLKNTDTISFLDLITEYNLLIQKGFLAPLENKYKHTYLPFVGWTDKVLPTFELG